MSANDRQVAGRHYEAKIQHWDFATENGLGYLEGNATKYVARWRRKNGVQDLQKALHYVEKLYEQASFGIVKAPGPWWRRLLGIRPRLTISVEAFGESNKLSGSDIEVIWLLSTWRSFDDLDRARHLILRQIRIQGQVHAVPAV